MSDGPISGLPGVTGFLSTQEFVVNEGGVSKKETGAQIQSAWGLDYLGSTKLLAGAHETAVVTIAPRDFLWIFIRIASYGGSPDASGDIGSLRFNGDSGPNYWTRHVEYFSGVWNDFQTTSATLIRLAAENSRLSRNVFVTVNNQANRSKTCNIKNQTGTNDATIVGSVNIAGGEWVNAVDQITSVQVVNQGLNNLGTGTGFIVMGKNF